MKLTKLRGKGTFRTRCKGLMGKRNISINKLAAEILVDPKSIRNYIDKKSVPSAIILKKLADYFEVSTDSLIQSQDRFSGQTIAALAVILRDFDVFGADSSVAAHHQIGPSVKEKQIEELSPCSSKTVCLLPFSKNCIFPEGKRTMLKS